MKINLPFLKDEYMKDAVTYQSWCWDLMVYQHAGCWRLHPSSLCYPFSTRLPRWVGEKFRDRYHSRWHINILDEQDPRCFELGTLTATNRWKRDSIRTGVCICWDTWVLMASFPEHFPPDHTAELKHDCFYGGLPKWLKAMVAYLKGSTNEKIYSDYLWAAREAEKEEAMEPSHSQTANNTTKSRAMSFFPVQKLKGT